MHSPLLTGQANGARTPANSSPCAGRARFCGTVMEPLLSRRLSGSFAAEVAVAVRPPRRAPRAQHFPRPSDTGLFVHAARNFGSTRRLSRGLVSGVIWCKTMIRNLGSILATSSFAKYLRQAPIVTQICLPHINVRMSHYTVLCTACGPKMQALHVIKSREISNFYPRCTGTRS
jgi:hypothetical protein